VPQNGVKAQGEGPEFRYLEKTFYHQHTQSRFKKGKGTVKGGSQKTFPPFSVLRTGITGFKFSSKKRTFGLRNQQGIKVVLQVFTACPPGSGGQGPGAWALESVKSINQFSVLIPGMHSVFKSGISTQKDRVKGQEVRALNFQHHPDILLLKKGDYFGDRWLRRRNHKGEGGKKE